MDVYQPGLDNEEICLGNEVKQSRHKHFFLCSFTVHIHMLNHFLCLLGYTYTMWRNWWWKVFCSPSPPKHRRHPAIATHFELLAFYICSIFILRRQLYQHVQYWANKCEKSFIITHTYIQTHVIFHSLTRLFLCLSGSTHKLCHW